MGEVESEVLCTSGLDSKEDVARDLAAIDVDYINLEPIVFRGRGGGMAKLYYLYNIRNSLRRSVGFDFMKATLSRSMLCEA